VDRSDRALWDAAVDVLRTNDRGGWTRPSPALYPHQWSWDSAFVAVGWSHLDPVRAVQELRSLFAAQWSTGMVPHIVFDPTAPAGSYEPGPEAWCTEGHSPPGTSTSAIVQPPVHAIALDRIRRLARRAGDDDSRAEVGAAIVELYPQLVDWHGWLRSARDPLDTGLVTILHPWESGLDNSPRWDAPLSAVPLDDPRGADPRGGATPAASLTEAARPDLAHVADPRERPSDDDYRRYHALVAGLVALDHDQARAMATHPFGVADVWFSAILAAADDALAALAPVAGHPGAAAEHRADADRTRWAVDECWDLVAHRPHDIDRITGRLLDHDTIAGFAPLVAGCDPDRAAVVVERLMGPDHCGHPALRFPLPPSTSPTDPGFAPRCYWRGPQWPPMTWLLWWSLERSGHRRTAARLRAAALDQLRTTGLCEYVDPLTGDALGSPAQSWTAAVTLDWLAADPTAPPL
jgi:hypothetical protein